MVKYIKNIEFRAVAGTLIDYKEQFGHEYHEDIRILKTLSAGLAKGNVIAEKYTDTTLKLAYCMTRHKGMTMQKLKEKKFTLPELNQINDFFRESFSQYENNGDSGREFSSENLMAVCMKTGFSTDDLYKYSIKFIMSVISEYISLGRPDKTESRKATQSDFDRFAEG